MNAYTLSNLTDMVKEGLHTRRFLKQINLTAEALDRIITRTSVDEAVAEVALYTGPYLSGKCGLLDRRSH